MVTTLGPDLPEVSDEDWARTPESVRRLVAALIERVARLEKEVADLREQLGRNSRNSSKPPSSDPPNAPPPKPAKKSHKKRGGQKGHARHDRARLPADRVVACVPAVCDHCEHALEGLDPDPAWHQVVDLPVILREVTEYQLHTLTCPACRKQSVGALPDAVTPSGFGPRLHALVALLAGRYRLSKRLTSEMLGEVFQIPMSLGAVSKCEARVGAALKAPYEEAHASARTSAWANVDETSWREDKKGAWLWVMATALVSVFLVHRNRSTVAAQTLMGEDFSGIAITDRYSAYLWLDPRFRQVCWSHLKRDFQAMVDRGGRSAEVGRRLQYECKRLFKWWSWVKQGLRARAWLAGKVKTVQRAVRAALKDGVVCGGDKTSGMCAEILSVFAALWTFVTVEGVEPTNNHAERELRPAVQVRKLSFGTDSERGSRFFERIMTVVMTLRRQKRALLDWLAEAYEAFRLRRRPPSLLPLPP